MRVEIRAFLFAVALTSAIPTVLFAQPVELDCGFNKQELKFRGNAQEQARCLLRPYGRHANTIGAKRELPEALSKRVGSAVPTPNDTRKKIEAYLRANKIRVADIGGSLANRVVESKLSNGSYRPAMYFVIHDTSHKVEEAMPDNRNTADWTMNQLWDATSYDDWWNIINVMTNRVGESRTYTDFATARYNFDFFGRTERGAQPRQMGRATEIEGDDFVAENELGRTIDVRNAFLHVENVQPRTGDDAACPDGDCNAPAEGFTDAQYKRLALIYTAASLRSGKWMVPAFHANIVRRSGRSGSSKDDPQNFDLSKWASILDALAREIGI